VLWKIARGCEDQESGGCPAQGFGYNLELDDDLAEGARFDQRVCRFNLVGGKMLVVEKRLQAAGICNRRGLAQDLAMPLLA
jgi:hypothetical protein